MSFLYNEQILEELERALAPKTAQAAQPVFSPRQMRNISLELVNGIKSSFSPIQTADNAQVFSKDLLNMDTLILWLVKNQVKYNGKPIALDSKPNDNEYIEYKVGTVSKYIYKNGLIGFLQDLQKQASSSNNAYFAEHVSGLVNDANQKLQAGLPEQENQQSDTTQQSTQPKNNSEEMPEQKNQLNQGNVQIQNIMEQTKQVLKQKTGDENLNLPFDLATNDINIQDIRDFAMSVSASYQTAIAQNKWGVIYSQIQQVLNQLANWTSVATPAAQQGGFELSANVSTDTFVETYANSDYKKARFMLLAIIPVIQSTYGLLNTLTASPVLLEMIGGQAALTNQTTRAQALISHAQAMIGQIELAIKKGS